jgi:hypothetical protein
MNIPRSIAENLAIAISQACWSSAEIATAGQTVFTKRQSWIAELAVSLRQQFPDQPNFGTLLEAIAKDSTFRQAASLAKTKKAHRKNSFAFRHLSWIDWRLPPFDDEQALASQLGISGTTLHWLTSLHRGPETRPRHYAARWIKKRNGQSRLIESPKAQLKSVQRLILQDILNRVPLHRAAHGFRPRRNVVSFTAPHINQACCLRMDLQDFFPAIGASRVRGMFRSIGYNRSVARCLTALTTTQTPVAIVQSQRPPGHRGAFELSKLYLPGHLPQGAPTSPAIANILAFRLDARLAGLARSAGVHYTRYADDLLFSGDEPFSRSAKTFAATVGAIALEEGFQVNFHKTRIQRSSQRQTATGVVLNRHANIRRKDFDRLKATLHNCIQHGPASQNWESVLHFADHLRGRINWVKQLNPARGEKLETLFAKINWDV